MYVHLYIHVYIYIIYVHWPHWFIGSTRKIMRLTKTKTSKDQAARFSPSPEGKELETSHFCPKRSVALAKSTYLMQKGSFKAKLEAGTKYLPMVEMTSSYAR